MGLEKIYNKIFRFFCTFQKLTGNVGRMVDLLVVVNGVVVRCVVLRVVVDLGVVVVDDGFCGGFTDSLSSS